MPQIKTGVISTTTTSTPKYIFLPEKICTQGQLVCKYLARAWLLLWWWWSEWWLFPPPSAATTLCSLVRSGRRQRENLKPWWAALEKWPSLSIRPGHLLGRPAWDWWWYLQSPEKPTCVICVSKCPFALTGMCLRYYVVVFPHLCQIGLSTPCSAGQHGSRRPTDRNLELTSGVYQAEELWSSFLK